MTVRMATRDASWYRRPNTRSPKVYHVVAPSYVAACNSRVLLVEESEVSVELAPSGLRCRREGCLNRWRELDHHDDKGT